MVKIPISILLGMLFAMLGTMAQAQTLPCACRVYLDPPPANGPDPYGYGPRPRLAYFLNFYNPNDGSGGADFCGPGSRGTGLAITGYIYGRFGSVVRYNSSYGFTTFGFGRTCAINPACAGNADCLTVASVVAVMVILVLILLLLQVFVIMQALLLQPRPLLLQPRPLLLQLPR